MKTKTIRRVVRHPISRRQITITAANEQQMAAMLYKLQMMRLDDDLEPTTVDRLVLGMRGKRVTLLSASEAYCARKDIAENTRRNVVSVLSAYAEPIASISVWTLDAKTMSTWIEGLKARLSPSTVTYAWLTVRAIVRYQVQIGNLSREPWGGWRPQIAGSKHLTRAREAARDTNELSRLLEAARLYDERQRARVVSYVEAACAVAVFLGLRQGELAGLAWPDISEARGTVKIARQWDGDGVRAKPKGKRALELRAPVELFGLFVEHERYLRRVELYEEAGPVFPSLVDSTPGHPRHRERGQHPLPPEVLRAVARLAELPNPERWTAQSLRDTFATLEAQSKGGDLVATAERTRHASIASLVRYLRSRTREPAPPGFTLPTLSRGPDREPPALLAVASDRHNS